VSNHQSQPQDLFLEIEQAVLNKTQQSQPERILFLSVLLQALLDATKPETLKEPEDEKVARDQAKAWFLASVGVTAEDFNEVCDLAGVSPLRMRSFAFQVLVSQDIPFVRKRINTVLSFK
jgi:hypothetical protein